MLKFIAGAILKLTGWTYIDNLPKDLKKGVLLFAPHTSFRDFWIGRTVFWKIGLKIYFLIKKEAFRPGISSIMKAMGGIPVDRSNPGGLVTDMATKLKESDKLIVMIAPEGTRQKTKVWKKGFYRIATEANVPIILGYIDYKKKIGGVFDIIYPTGNYEEDLLRIKEYYKDVTPRYPDQFCLPEK